MICWVDR